MVVYRLNKPCSAGVYETLPDGSTHSLEEVRESLAAAGWRTVEDAGVLVLMVNEEGNRVTLYANGSIRIEAPDEERAERILERLSKDSARLV